MDKFSFNSVGDLSSFLIHYAPCLLGVLFFFFFFTTHVSLGFELGLGKIENRDCIMDEPGEWFVRTPRAGCDTERNDEA